MNIKPDTAGAVAFLKSWPARPVMLSASHVDPVTHEKGLFETQSFPEPVEWSAVGRWIDGRAEPTSISL